MAVYVLLQFDDEQGAKDFVKGVIVRSSVYAVSPGQQYSVPVTLWGIWKKPTKYCDCVGGRKTLSGFTRGLNYGWWVCGKCKKPTKKWSTGTHWFSVLGTNLLPKSLRPYPDEMSITLESPKVWADLEQCGNPD